MKEFNLLLRVVNSLFNPPPRGTSIEALENPGPAEGKAGKDHKKLKKGQASSTEFSYELSLRRLGYGR